MYHVVVRFQSGATTQRREFPDWAGINAYIVGLGKLSVLRGTVATVTAPGGAEQRYSVRGGGSETVKMVPLTNKLTMLPGNENPPEPSAAPTS